MATGAERSRRWREKHPEASRAATASYKERNADAVRERNRQARKRLYDSRKQQVLGAYGNRCVCCQEDREVFLEVDHVDGRRVCGHSRRLSGMQFYKLIIEEGFPSKYRLLCANCNRAYALTGTCPHVEDGTPT